MKSQHRRPQQRPHGAKTKKRTTTKKMSSSKAWLIMLGVSAGIIGLFVLYLNYQSGVWEDERRARFDDDMENRVVQNELFQVQMRNVRKQLLGTPFDVNINNELNLNKI